MANARFKTTIELDVEVVGHYTGETRARGMGGPPEDSEPGEAEGFEIEAVMVTRDGHRAVNVLELLDPAVVKDLETIGCDEAREGIDDAMAAAAEARRDAREDR